MKRAVLIFAALLAAFSATALPLSVSWLDGRVDVQKGTIWSPISIGDKVDSSATLRLGQGALVELSGGGRRISITVPGTYGLAAFYGAGLPGDKAGADLLQKMGKLVETGVSSSQTSVAGVRGAAVEPSSDSVTWATDDTDSQAIMDEGRALARDGKYDEAAAKFDQAGQATQGAAKDSAQYAEAWALSAGGSVARAVKLLRAMPASGTWAGPRTLLLARLDLDSGAGDEAKSILDAGLASGLFAGDDATLAQSMLAEANQGQ
ncbi:MAG TPA: hypothetical protein VMV44_08895 [Rectinemataceae bacterium]|nr:hypothetical protein [Rectinemataceae bacterium]